MSRKFRITWNQGPYWLRFWRRYCGISSDWVLVIGSLVFSYMGSDKEVEQ